jgi:mono/diheme cytochrome c family protein
MLGHCPERANCGLLRSVLLSVMLAGSVASAMAQTPTLERGRYLVSTIMACGNCHTPKDPEGRPVAAKELAGGGLGFDTPPFAGTASNITPDRESGIGSWSDNEIKRALTHGVRPDRGPLAGKPLAAPMAVNFFKALTPTDLDAIVAYLRTLPPQPH